MPDKKTDPNALFGQMLAQWETVSNDIANTMMGTSVFGQGQNAAMTASRFLEATNMPSREDIVELRAAVAKLDAKMDRIERMLVESSAPARESQRPAKSPPRTRKPRTTSKQAGKDG